MDEKVLLRMAFVFGIIGLIGLYFVSLDDEVSSYGNGLSKVGDEVTAMGQVKFVNSNENMSFVTLSYEKELEVVLFDPFPLPLEKGDLIEARGVLDEYEGKDEILASEIRLLAR